MIKSNQLIRSIAFIANAEKIFKQNFKQFFFVYIFFENTGTGKSEVFVPFPLVQFSPK